MTMAVFSLHGWHYKSRKFEGGVVYDVYNGGTLISTGWSLRVASMIVMSHK